MEGAARSESDTVASYSFGVALLSYLAANALQEMKQEIALNTNKVLKMAIFHDLGESATGEIATGVKNWLPPNVLTNVERKLLEALVEDVSGSKEFLSLAREYDKGKTEEAIVVKFADILEAFAHAKDRLGKTFPGYMERKAKSFEEKAAGGSKVAAIIARWLKQLQTEEWVPPKRPWAKQAGR